MSESDVIIIGGGAAGFFAAVNIAEKHPDKSITILEKGKELLRKVKVSGGGRCNVTHACFEPKPLSKFYPRGERELIGPFHQFCSGDTVEWFSKRGIPLKIEDDGRIFPESDSSETIIQCFLREAKKYGIKIVTETRVDELKSKEDGWSVKTNKGVFHAEKIIYSTGSSDKSWSIIEKLGHQLVTPVPSLFTFNIQDSRIAELPGVSVPLAKVTIEGKKLSTEGPLLITHWGLSGPGILRLSAWGARLLSEINYHFNLIVNWIPPHTHEEIIQLFGEYRQIHAKKKISANPLFQLPKRLWASLLHASAIDEDTNWADISKKQVQKLANELVSCNFQVKGKSTFKEEFVTAGGVELSEVNLKTFESKHFPGLYFAGEVLNIDAITGGFNFQAAWTGGWVISENIFS
jgi:predicted Rossmann fold flavoprotein